MPHFHYLFSPFLQVIFLLCYIFFQSGQSQRLNIIQNQQSTYTTMSENLQKQIINRVKRIKCQQAGCKSNNLQTLQIAVVGDQNYKRKGIMCTSCFIDQELINDLGDVQLHTLSIQKFLRVLTENYLLYAQEKGKADWPPVKVDGERQQIRKKIFELEKTVTRGILDVMKFLDDAIKQATQNVKKTNNDKSMQKILQLINQQDQNEQERINVGNQLKDITSKLIKDHGQFKLSTEEEIKKQNEIIMLDFKQKVARAKQTINKLVEVHKKCLKYLIQ